MTKKEEPAAEKKDEGAEKKEEGDKKAGDKKEGDAKADKKEEPEEDDSDYWLSEGEGLFYLFNYIDFSQLEKSNIKNFWKRIIKNLTILFNL